MGQYRKQAISILPRLTQVVDDLVCRVVIVSPFIRNRRKILVQTVVRQSIQGTAQPIPIVWKAFQLLEKGVISIEIQSLTSPRRLPTDYAREE